EVGDDLRLKRRRDVEAAIRRPGTLLDTPAAGKGGQGQPGGKAKQGETGATHVVLLRVPGDMVPNPSVRLKPVSAAPGSRCATISAGGTLVSCRTGPPQVTRRRPSPAAAESGPCGKCRGPRRPGSHGSGRACRGASGGLRATCPPRPSGAFRALRA